MVSPRPTPTRPGAQTWCIRTQILCLSGDTIRDRQRPARNSKRVWLFSPSQGELYSIEAGATFSARRWKQRAAHAVLISLAISTPTISALTFSQLRSAVRGQTVQVLEQEGFDSISIRVRGNDEHHLRILHCRAR
jgi:hypothetical protein